MVGLLVKTIRRTETFLFVCLNIADSQTQVGVGLLEDLLRVEMIGGEVLSPAHDGVDLLGQLLGLLLQLLMLLHTPQTVSRRSS